MKKSIFLALIFSVTLISYQNCSEELGTLGGNPSAKSDGIPFPYEVSVDTIAHMSCKMSSHQPSVGQGAHFTFKAIANRNYQSSGIKLSNEFVTFVSNKGEYAEAVDSYLQKSKKIKDLRMQFSLKDPLDLVSVRNTYTSAFDHISLTDSHLFYSMAFPGAIGSYAPLGVTFPLSPALDFRSAVLPDEVYQNINGMVLTVDFSKTSDPNNSIAPGTYGEGSDVKQIFGKRYNINMVDIGNSKRAYVNSLEERYAHTNTPKPNTTWACVRYKVIKPGDANHGCGGSVTSILANSNDAEIARLHKVLGPNWNFLHGSDRCVQRTDNLGGCYYENAGNVQVEYNYVTMETGGCTENGSNGTKVCANFLSVCHKSSF